METRGAERHTNLAQLLAQSAQGSPDAVALVEAESGKQLTWAELAHLVDQVAIGLAAQGVRAGQRVLIALGNRLEFVAAYLGILRAGAVAVPVNPKSTAVELQLMTQDCAARLGICDETTIVATREAIATAPATWRAVPTVVVVDAPTEAGETSWSDFVSASGSVVPPPAEPESLAVLLYTSGTSRRPRAAMLTHRALLANIEQVAQTGMTSAADVGLAVLPLFHVYGLNAVLGQMLRQGHQLVLAKGFDPAGTSATVAKYRVTSLPVAPPVIAYWVGREGLAQELRTVRTLLCGSAPLDDDVSAAFTAQTGLVIHQGYGLTEAAPVVTSTVCSQSVKPGSVGAPLPGVEVAISGDSGAEDQSIGEILIRGGNIFSGYWPDAGDGPDTDGWWATGDVGYLDAEGDLFLVDRLKELIIVSGFNVYPSEVEETLADVVGVEEAAVIGVPDPITGEAVVAYVVPSPGADPAMVVAACHEACQTRLARFKRPVRVDVVPDLRHGVTGKVQKGRLRAHARRALTPLVEER